jgi:hypothetical protein
MGCGVLKSVRAPTRVVCAARFGWGGGLIQNAQAPSTNCLRLPRGTHKHTQVGDDAAAAATTATQRGGAQPQEQQQQQQQAVARSDAAASTTTNAAPAAAATTTAAPAPAAAARRTVTIALDTPTDRKRPKEVIDVLREVMRQRRKAERLRRLRAEHAGLAGAAVPEGALHRLWLRV